MLVVSLFANMGKLCQSGHPCAVLRRKTIHIWLTFPRGNAEGVILPEYVFILIIQDRLFCAHFRRLPSQLASTSILIALRYSNIEAIYQFSISLSWLEWM